MSRPRDVAQHKTGDPALLCSIARAEGTERRRLLENFVVQHAAHVLRLRAEQLPREKPMGELGMDSVMGLEFRNRLVAALGFVIPATVLWTYPTIHALAGYLADALGSPERTTPNATMSAAFSSLDDEGKARQLAEGIAVFERLLEGLPESVAV